MKKLITLLMLICVAFLSIAGTRTIKADKVLLPDVTSPNSITWKYKGVAADSLTANQDTLIYNITVNKSVPMNYYIKVGLDTIAGVEPLATIRISGRMFDDEAWTLIETVNTEAITAEINTVVESMTDADYIYTTASHTSSNPSHTLASTIFDATYTEGADTTITYPVITFTEGAQTITEAAAIMTPTPSIKPCWRQIQVMISVVGDNITGDGILLKDINWYFQEVSN